MIRPTSNEQLGELTISVLESDDAPVFGQPQTVLEGVKELLHAHLLVHKDALSLATVPRCKHKHL